MTYQQALAFWFGRVNYEQRSPKPSDLKLDRMHALLDRLGNPQQNLRIVHIAGSKGKGSTSAMLAAILRQAGYRSGLFTSPHLVRVEERIEVDGGTITKDELASAMAQVAQATADLEARTPALCPVTFFEVATALGFLHFVRRRVELAVIEVGLGGRFDSTNVCRPLVSIITSISYDHTQQLGNTLARIAYEKAGIVKADRPTVSGVRGSEARAVIEETCRQRGAPLRQLDADFRFVHTPAQVWEEGQRLPRIQVTTPKQAWPSMEIGLLGEHQAANAAVAVMAVEQLRAQGMTIDDRAVAAGLAGVQWPARLEVLCRQPLVLLDCAHNLASAQAMIDTLHASFPGERSGRRLLIFGGNRDKDLRGMLHLLANHFTHVFLTRFDNPRCVPPEDLLELAPETVPCTVCPTSEAAWLAARSVAGPHDLICVTGSVFLAGELRPILVRDLAYPLGNGQSADGRPRVRERVGTEASANS
jgi:dihydrofolate synthase/folylpolyglutamate synthase